MNSTPLSVCQARSRREMPQRPRCCWMRAAKTALTAALRRCAKAQNNKPLRTSRAVYGISHFTDQLEVAGGGHGSPILVALRGATLPPVAPRSPSFASRSNTSTSPGGYDVSRLFHRRAFLDTRKGGTYNDRFEHCRQNAQWDRKHG